LKVAPRFVGGKLIETIDRGWFPRFLDRHQNLTTRKCQMIADSNFEIQEKALGEFYAHIYKKLEEDNCLDILSDPSRMIDVDEMGVCLNCKESKYNISYLSIL
jgi:hypothetical protein